MIRRRHTGVRLVNLSLSLPFALFTPLSLSRWSRPEERTGETLTMGRLLGPEEELRSITSVGSGGPDLGRLYSKSLASDSENTSIGCGCTRRVGVAALGDGDGRRDCGIVRMGLLWKYGSALFLRLMSLVPLLLHEVKCVIPVAFQALPPSLFALALAFSLPLAFFTVYPSTLPLPFASRISASRDPFIGRNDSRS